MNPWEDSAILQILWSRLESITQEMFTTVWRTAFTPVVAIIQDHGCAILDADGNSLAHAPASMPAFNLTMPLVAKAVIAQIGVDRMKPGDVFATNDPWLSAGHLNDICVLTPLFHGGRPIGFCGTIAHAHDIGGIQDNRRPRSLYEEGLQIPISYLYEAGRKNDTLFNVIAANVRHADAVIGDVEAMVTANAVGAREVQRLLAEYELSDLKDVGKAIFRRTQDAVKRAVRAIPDGTYRGEVQFDGWDTPLTLKASIQVDGDRLHVDFSGSSSQVAGGINCTLAYTTAQTFYSLMCALTPHLPNNQGSLAAFSVWAPPGSILNCRRPAPVNLRLRTGWHINTILYQALAPVLGDRVMAGSGFLAALQARGKDERGEDYLVPFFAGGGQGASCGRDGRAGYIFPSTAAGMAVEWFEAATPLFIERKELLQDSGGAGQWRGGLGQRIAIRTLPGWDRPVDILMAPDRVHCPAPGLAGGHVGGPARVCLDERQPGRETPFLTDGYIVLDHPDRTLVWEIPGGGGYGEPSKRDPAAVRRDVAMGFVSEKAAREIYNYTGEL